MNGVGTRKPSVTSGYDGRSGARSSSRSSTRPMLNGYGPPYHAGHRPSQPSSRYDGAPSLHADDPVTMHLLMETAIGDSQSYAIISIEEVETLKRDLPILKSRIEATNRQLAIASKARDAASSIARLDGRTGHRRATSGIEGEVNEEAIAAAHQKCEDLNQELRQLEQRQQDVQRKILEHTAGVLQKTHRGSLEKNGAVQRNGFESHPHGYEGLDLVGNTDDSSFYRTLDALLDGGTTKQDSTNFKLQTQAILETERKVYDLNERLRDAITQASFSRSTIPAPPDPTSDSQDPNASLQSQISYLEKGIEKMQRDQVETMQAHKSTSQHAEERLEDLNTQLHGLVMKSSHDPNLQHPLPPEITGQSFDGQLAFLENGLDLLEQGVFRLKEEHQNVASRSKAHEEKATRYEQALHGVWQDISDGEKFSTDSFSSKILSLTTKISDLTNQKDILNRQIQQQREINSKSDGEKDAKLGSITAELEQAKAEAGKERQEMQDFEGDMVRLQTELTVARAELDGAYGTRAQRAAEVAQHPALQQEIAELKKELDATREKSGDSAELRQLVETLKSELKGMASDYETLTKSSIEHEKEVESLENAVDNFRDKCEALETQLAEERVSKLGAKSPGTAGDRSSVSTEKGATSTSVLKNEFKKMMKDTRAENMRALRHEQDERRKLETQIRELKRGQTPGKSSLSQSMTAS